MAKTRLDVYQLEAGASGTILATDASGMVDWQASGPDVGNVAIWNGSVWVAGALGAANASHTILVYAASGNFIPASYDDASNVKVRAVGGGGGSGGTGATGVGESAAAAGGAGGEYAESSLDIDSLASSVVVTPGAGGAGGAAGANNGSTGSTSSFGSDVIAIGGGGGEGMAGTTSTVAADGGQTGTGSTGQIVMRADDGFPGVVRSGNVQNYGHGGGSVMSGVQQRFAGSPQEGLGGYQYGGGAAGAFAGASTAARAGAAGADGVVIVEIFGGGVTTVTTRAFAYFMGG